MMIDIEDDDAREPRRSRRVAVTTVIATHACVALASEDRARATTEVMYEGERRTRHAFDAPFGDGASTERAAERER